MHSLLLVEDDKNLGYILSEYLSMKDFAVTWAKDGAEAIALIQKNTYSLCILDVMLPTLDGFDVARKISELTFKVPFIFLTAKTLKVDRLKGFSLGCDDYILKPVDEEELVARIHAVLKRTGTPLQTVFPAAVQVGISLFDADSQELNIGGTIYKLTRKEAEMLQLLVNSKNHLVGREHALRQIWGTNDYFNRRSMDVIISRLRKHLSADESVRITNVHGRGYILTEDRKATDLTD